MESINLIIIPEWNELDEEKQEFYDRLYERLTTEEVNVGFAATKKAFLPLLDLIAQQESRYLFLTGEGTGEEEKAFIRERLAEKGYGPEWIRGLDELMGSTTGIRKQLEGWLREIESPPQKERRGK